MTGDQPNSATLKAPSDWDLFRKLIPFLRPNSGYFVVAFLAAPLSAAMVVLQPYLLKVAIDDYIIPQDPEGLKRIAIIYFLVILCAFLTQTGYSLALSYGALKSITNLRRAVFTHTLALSQGFFDHQPTGRLLTRATSDIEALGETLTAGAITVVLDALLVLGILGAMCALDFKLTAITLLVAPPLALIVDIIRRILRKLYLKVRTTLAELNAYTAERLTGVQLVQLYSDEERTIAQFDERLHRYRDTTIKTNIWDAFLFALVDGLGSVSMAVMLWYGSQGFGSEVVTIGLLAAFIDYIGRLFQPIREFSAKVAIIQRAVTALQKIFGLLDEKSTIQAGHKELSAPIESIEFKDVSFAYSKKAGNVLNHINLNLVPGEVVALVGRTGSGKTTIGKLLSRAYSGYDGQIFINKTELQEYTTHSARRNIGVIRQDTDLFPATVHFNISMGHEMTAGMVEVPIDNACATNTVTTLGGLDGLIRHQGSNVSIGEGQLLSFARSIAYDSPVIILDEATASIDTLTEAKVQQATKHVLANKTVLVIAHRLSTIVHADRIVVIDGGRIVEMGTHRQLIQNGGYYSELYESQFSELSEPQSPQSS